MFKKIIIMIFVTLLCGQNSANFTKDCRIKISRDEEKNYIKNIGKISHKKCIKDKGLIIHFVYLDFNDLFFACVETSDKFKGIHIAPRRNIVKIRNGERNERSNKNLCNVYEELENIRVQANARENVLYFCTPQFLLLFNERRSTQLRIITQRTPI